MRRFTAVENESGHYDFMEVNMYEGSYRFKSLFGFEWTYNSSARQFVVRIVLVGLTIGITGGISVGADG